MEDKKFDLRLIKAIIGLGNPGVAYHKTRHNIGFRIIDTIAEQSSSLFNQHDNKEYAKVDISLSDGGIVSVYLIKPLTFMNKSGEVILFLQKKGIKPEEILVIHDELEKPFGNISIKFGGSAKGHNGLKSIINYMGQDFWRLRFGIGRPGDKSDVGSYVLSPFTKEEESQVADLIQKSASLILRQLVGNY
jgi:peptidyl-tRNA hydrolase, PTH1 family